MRDKWWVSDPARAESLNSLDLVESETIYNNMHRLKFGIAIATI